MRALRPAAHDQSPQAIDRAPCSTTAAVPARTTCPRHQRQQASWAQERLVHQSKHLPPAVRRRRDRSTGDTGLPSAVPYVVVESSRDVRDKQAITKARAKTVSTRCYSCTTTSP